MAFLLWSPVVLPVPNSIALRCPEVCISCRAGFDSLSAFHPQSGPQRASGELFLACVTIVTTRGKGVSSPIDRLKEEIPGCLCGKLATLKPQVPRNRICRYGSGRGFWKERKSVEFSQQRSPASWMRSPAVTCLARSSRQEQSKA